MVPKIAEGLEMRGGGGLIDDDDDDDVFASVQSS